MHLSNMLTSKFLENYNQFAPTKKSVPFIHEMFDYLPD